MIERTFSILKNEDTGPVQVPIIFKTGEVVVITGPNGTGKSALLDEIALSLGQATDVEKFPGFRQIYFSNEGDVDQMGSLRALHQQLNYPDSVNRQRNPWSEVHLKSIIRRNIDCQAQATNYMVEKQDAGLTLPRQNSFIRGWSTRLTMCSRHSHAG